MIKNKFRRISCGTWGQTLKMTFMSHRIRLYWMPNSILWCTKPYHGKVYIPYKTFKPYRLIPLACLHTPIRLLHFIMRTHYWPVLQMFSWVQPPSWWPVSDPGAFLCFCQGWPQFNGNILPVLGPALTSASGPPYTHRNDILCTAWGVLDSNNCTWDKICIHNIHISFFQNIRPMLTC